MACIACKRVVAYHAMYSVSIQVMNQFDLPDLIGSKILCFQHGHSTCHWFPIVYIFNRIKLYLQNPQTLIMDVSHLLLCSVAFVHWHFIDNIFKCISLNKNHIFFQLFLGFVCNGLIDNTSASVCLMALHQARCDKPSPEQCWPSFKMPYGITRSQSINMVIKFNRSLYLPLILPWI